MSSTVAPAAPAPSRARSVGRALLGAPFRAGTWRSFGYLLVRIPLAALGFGLVLGLLVGAGFSLTVVGLPLVALLVYAGRGYGALLRSLAGGVLGVHVPPPAPRRRRPGVLGWCASVLSDVVAWRGIAYALVALPVVLVGGYAVVVWVGLAVGSVAYPAWKNFGDRPDDVIQLGGHPLDSGVEVTLVVVAGVVALWLAPWLVRGVVALDLLLQRWLLAGTPSDRRVAVLEAARAEVVEDAAATLRRVERDLHDGTQAQLVAVAMTLDRARGRLAAGDAEGAATLLDGAHGATKEALTDLRDVVRRIHPPVLDQGLAPALHTLTARCALPVRLEAEVPVRPEPGVETIAYFCVAELLTNAVRHSGARAAEVTVHGDLRGDLDITVRDDGNGGATIVAGSNGHTGLAGLEQRVHAVDGRFELDSPVGGPTVVRVLVPSGGTR